jgi:flavin-binding protein dodecin
MSLYRVVRLIGSSPTSWEEAAKAALEEAAKHLEDLRVAEVEQLDVRMKDNKVVEYRARVRASFRYHPEKALTRCSLYRANHDPQLMRVCASVRIVSAMVDGR